MYPIALSLRGRRVLVVGGGSVAERKVRGLLEAAARITVVSPTATGSLCDLARDGRIALEQRGFVPDDVAGVVLCFAATNDPAVNGAVVAAARERAVLVDDLSDAARSDFAVPAVHRAGPLTVAVDSGGLSPSFARRVRDELGARIDERYARAAAALGAVRARVTATIPEPQRAAVMRQFAERDVDALAALSPAAIEREIEHVVATLAAEPRSARPLVCASRASALALVQTRGVLAELAAAGIASVVLELTTRGDTVQDRAVAAIGSDNVWVTELEAALRDGRADLAVHSCKDLPSALAADMRLAAITVREDARDAFCSERYASFDALPSGARVGTSSPRRRALLAALRPDLVFDDVRGNVDTRLRKLREGQYDALVLAAAGLARLGARARHTVPFATDVLVPAVGQGALGVETRAADALAERLGATLGDPPTAAAVTSERAFLRTLRAGCGAPVGAHAAWDGPLLRLRAAIASADGARVLRGARDARLEP
ncbi:MAG: hydroxymethylbilane synthase, partial [Candidatus Eremiobacteraeota bacterium]|nr:hydroxymethylbilane synthase [Candidatus Eremiobacteraeota bacterium]